MHPKMMKSSEAPKKISAMIDDDPSKVLGKNQPSFAQFDSGNLCFDSRFGQSFPEFPPNLDNIQLIGKMNRFEQIPPHVNGSAPDWNPRAMLQSLSFLEQKIHQMQDIVRSVINHENGFCIGTDEVAAQQQLVKADLTSIIIELISTAGNLLPSIKSTLVSPNNNYAGQQLGDIIGSSSSNPSVNANSMQNPSFPKDESNASSELEEIMKDPIMIEENDVKDHDDDGDGENLPPGSYEVLQLEKEEILAPHTHFCTICGKGFKRDANLRMHMRGHGDEYKTPAALAKPAKEACSDHVPIRRYSCPFVGCKRNKEHKKFQPLKTILCVKNHYKRSHCDKTYTCSRCNTKKFSVIADLKTHEKHCGQDKWICSCGTTFSRKDKLFGHVALFQGHTPALPNDEGKVAETSEQGKAAEAVNGEGSSGFKFTDNSNSFDDGSLIDIKGLEDDRVFFSAMNFDNFGGFDDFQRPPFDISESSFSLSSGATSAYVQRHREHSSLSQFS